MLEKLKKRKGLALELLYHYIHKTFDNEDQHTNQPTHIIYHEKVSQNYLKTTLSNLTGVK